MPHGGARLGAGRKPRNVEVYRKQMELTLLACVTQDDWATVVLSALSRAKAGDSLARQWLSDRVMGKVKDESAHEHSGKVEIEVTYSRRGADPSGPAGAAPGPAADQG